MKEGYVWSQQHRFSQADLSVKLIAYPTDKQYQLEGPTTAAFSKVTCHHHQIGGNGLSSGKYMHIPHIAVPCQSSAALWF